MENVFTVLVYFVSLFVIVISVFISLMFKYELERLFREKKAALPFHICNVLITLMVSLGAHAVMTIYIMEEEFHLIQQLAILLFMIFPIYILGHLAFERYKSVYRKYMTAENGKVIVLNEKYLKKKKRFSKLDDYNAISRED
ncbi:hypothetical protein [Bacillus sp. REN3]|uniref:hypothetical protein n=1 Tax=Bacillus sp. REN3 TaxID=2802440 RepID=UPI001FEE4C35|nr:hypothetical protein [Bacillus sp. REN3]